MGRTGGAERVSARFLAARVMDEGTRRAPGYEVKARRRRPGKIMRLLCRPSLRSLR